MEYWKDINGYEGLYQVSNYGRVRSLPRKTTSGKILTQFISRGYYKVVLCKDNIKKNWNVHKLVAIAFVPNPNNYTDINHKDENKLNNIATNLEWCSKSYNQRYGTRNKRMLVSRNGCNKEKPVFQLDMEGSLIKEWISATEASRILNINRESIRRCCIGKRKTAGGFIWKYK